jgi:hypothetical protein
MEIRGVRVFAGEQSGPGDTGGHTMSYCVANVLMCCKRGARGVQAVRAAVPEGTPCRTVLQMF